jgi:hypothetical protein
MEEWTNNSLSVYLNSLNNSSKQHFIRNVEKFLEITADDAFQDADGYEYMNNLHEI